VRDPVGNGRANPRKSAFTLALVLGGVIFLAVTRPRLAGTIGVLAAIIAMIMLHELGHFVMAKRAGMKVTEFFLGFGPRLWSTRRGETEYGVKAIPAGGYVRIIGMSNVEEVDPADEERTYRAKPYRHRLGVAVAGSAMHFILATLLLFMVYAAVGLPAARPVVAQIVDDSPAAASDFRVGDRIVAINGQPVKEWEDVPRYVESHGETPLTFTVQRGSQRIDIPLVPRAVEQGGKKVPKVGIGAQQYLDRMSIPSAIGHTAVDIPRFTWATIDALGNIFSPAGVANWFDLVTGSEQGDDNGRLLSPVGAARVAGQAVDSGWGAVLMFLVAINLFVGVFNMVPLLPLDGGHVAIATYEKIASTIKGRRVQVDVARLLPITAAVVAVIVFIGLSALYIDIIRPVPVGP
jgi:membrane-associated protease RseP (regulator of RpoE activity)